MSSSVYIRARAQASERDVSYCAFVDGKPYLPFLVVDADEDESILNAAMMIMRNSIISSDPCYQMFSKTKGETVRCVSRIVGGITNQLFKVDLPSSDPVLIRIFGAPGLIDRDVENSNYAALAKRGIAPPYHGRFANGRVEGWLDMRALEVSELARFAPEIATQLGKLHLNFVPEIIGDPTLWSQLRSWMDQALIAKFQNEVDERRVAALDLHSLPAELDYLHDFVVPKNARVAFCHNDLLAANILVSADSTEIQLIDFEYGGLNFIAFDIANHFNEYAGGTDDGIPRYSQFPNENMQKVFIESYLRAVAEIEPTELDVRKLGLEVQAFVLVNHLYWGLWAINQASVEGCRSFDYLLYATNRISRYHATKS